MQNFWHLIPHRELSIHERYRLEVFFLYVSGFFLLFPFYMFVELYGFDSTLWQWYFFVPWMLFYSIYSLRMRATIPAREEIKPLKRHIVHWVLLGLSIVLIHLQPTKLGDLRSFDYSFIVFSLFLADSYWDFRSIGK